MTLKSSSLHNKFNAKHRFHITPAMIVSFITLLLFYISGVILLVNRAENYGHLYHQTPDIIKMEQLNAVSKMIGFRQLGIGFVVILAIVFAMLEFNYLFSQKKLDFFLSQPTSNRKRFWTRYCQGFLSFLVIYFLTIALTLLTAAIMRTLNGAVMTEALMAFAYAIVVFFTFYNGTILGIMVSGNLFSAVIMSVFCLSVISCVELLITGYKSIFFVTYSSYTNEMYLLSPVYDAVMTYASSNNVFGYYTASMNMSDVKTIINVCLPFIIDSAISAAVYLILALIAYKRRKTEWAGKTICFGPVQKLVKISASVICGMVLGALVYNIYPMYDDSKSLLILVAMIMGAFFTSLIVESFLQIDIKAFYKGVLQTVVSVVAVVIIFVIYNSDVFGYDSYVPNSDEIKSGLIVNTSSYGYWDNYNEYNADRADVLEKKMYLTDTDALCKLAEVACDNINSHKNYYYSTGWTIDMGFRLKDGRIVYRQLSIPYDVDTELMDRVFGCDEYKTAYFDIYDDSYMTDEAKSTGFLEFDNYNDYLTGSGLLYDDFKDAYIKDLELYDFSLASSEEYIGIVQFSSYGDNYSSPYISVSYPVYECFQNTTRFLKDNNLYLDKIELGDNITSITVTNYYPGYNLEEMEDTSDLMSESSVEKIYTDSEDFKEIFPHLVLAGQTSDWYASNKLNDQYGVIVTYIAPTDVGDSRVSTYFVFKKGEVPDFVVADTNN
ncbi:MAG: ABC transporter permease [Butyrivibrio sp.]|nr:ABC transporter permease [Butyrivibrio sp.]